MTNKIRCDKCDGPIDTSYLYLTGNKKEHIVWIAREYAVGMDIDREINNFCSMKCAIAFKPKQLEKSL